MNCDGVLPAWTKPPVFPLPSVFLVGHIVDSDTLVVLETKKDGTCRVLSRLGVCWVVTAFLRDV